MNRQYLTIKKSLYVRKFNPNSLRAILFSFEPEIYKWKINILPRTLIPVDDLASEAAFFS